MKNFSVLLLISMIWSFSIVAMENNRGEKKILSVALPFVTKSPETLSAFTNHPEFAENEKAQLKILLAQFPKAKFLQHESNLAFATIIFEDGISVGIKFGSKEMFWEQVNIIFGFFASDDNNHEVELKMLANKKQSVENYDFMRFMYLNIDELFHTIDDRLDKLSDFNRRALVDGLINNQESDKVLGQFFAFLPLGENPGDQLLPTIGEWQSKINVYPEATAFKEAMNRSDADEAKKQIRRMLQNIAYDFCVNILVPNSFLSRRLEVKHQVAQIKSAAPINAKRISIQKIFMKKKKD